MNRAQPIPSPVRGHQPLRVLVAEDDPVHLQLIERTIRQHSDHEVIAVRDGDAALASVLSEHPPDVLILDWVMPGLAGTEVCRRIRAMPLPVQPHVLIVTAKNRREEVIAGLSVGADDLLCKPVPPDLLMARLRVASLRPTSMHVARRDMIQALLDACLEGDGELVVRDGDVTARVYVHEGRVAWAHLSDGPAFFELLADDNGVGPDVLRDVLEECRRTGTGVTEMMVRWGLVDRARLREAAKLWTQRKVKAICRLPQAQSLFLPQRRRYAGDLLFALDELLDDEDLRGLVTSARPPAPEPESERRSWGTAFVPDTRTRHGADRLMDLCMEGEGVLGVAMIDRGTGCCAGTRGQELNADIAWALLQSLSIISRDEAVVDTVLTTNRHYHLVHAVPGDAESMVYLVVDASKTHMGSARRQLRDTIEGHSGPLLVRSPTGLSSSEE